MTRVSRMFAVALVGLLTAAAAPPAVPGTSFHDAEIGFTVTVPDGWEPIAPALLDAAPYSFGRTGGPGGMRTVAGFQPKGRAGVDYPYAMIHVLPYRGGQLPSEAEMQAVVAGFDQRARCWTARSCRPSSGR